MRVHASSVSRAFFKPSGSANIQLLSALRDDADDDEKEIIEGVSLFDGGGSPSFMDGPHLSQSVARMPFRDLIDGYMKHRSPDTCDSSTASPSVRSRSGSDATFEVPAPMQGLRASKSPAQSRLEPTEPT